MNQLRYFRIILEGIALANFENFIKRSYHTDIIYHFVHDYVKKKTTEVCRTEYKSLVADLLTKSLSINKFKKFRNKLNIYSFFLFYH